MSGLSSIRKHERNITSLMDTLSIVSPQVSVNHGSRRSRLNFNGDNTDPGKRKREVPNNCYFELTREVEEYARDNRQTDTLLQKKLKLQERLSKLFRRKFPQCSLFLVGSSLNGFASNTSDADFCLMLSDRHKVDQRFEAHGHLKSLEELLLSFGFAKKITVITAAVIPILKFQDAISGIECDINIHNPMNITNHSAKAVRKTHLLRAYSKVDDRIQPLVLTMKRWAKARSINDASQGTLSNYSLMLMIIHFLQSACSPPVVKSLQEEYPHLFNESRPLNALRMSEPGDKILCNSSENQQSVGELLEQFFHYYAYEFDYSYQGVSVRSVRPIRKYWKAKCIYVEEPFGPGNAARAVRDQCNFRRIKEEFERAASGLKKRLSIESIL